MKNKIDFYSKITIAIVLALLTSQLLVKEVFLGYSPRIRPDLADVVMEKGLALINIDNYLALFKGKSGSNLAKSEEEAKKELEKVSLKATLVKGVYAKETENAAFIEVNMNEVSWVEIPYQKASGETIMLRIPQGTKPPASGMF